jgi:Tfp pilus assembly protein PilF
VVGLLEALLPLAQGRLRHKARVLLAQTYFKNPRWRRQAEAEMLGALEETSGSADVRFALAEMYRDWGQREKAVEAYREVLKLQPKHRRALAELAELTASETGGLLKKLLGR